MDSSTSTGTAVPPYVEVEEENLAYHLYPYPYSYPDLDEPPPPSRFHRPLSRVRPALPNRSSVSLSGATVVDPELRSPLQKEVEDDDDDVRVEDISPSFLTSPTSARGEHVTAPNSNNGEPESPTTPTMTASNANIGARRPLLLPPIPELSPTSSSPFFV